MLLNGICSALRRRFSSSFAWPSSAALSVTLITATDRQHFGVSGMTDPMELVGRLENIATGSFPYVASVAAEAAACIREMVDRQLPAISKDGPNETDRHGRFWLARQLLDSKLTAEEAYGIVAHHPAIQDALPPAPGAEDE